jgi:hypothetical protein
MIDPRVLKVVTGSVIEEFSDGGWEYILTENELISYLTGKTWSIVRRALRSTVRQGQLNMERRPSETAVISTALFVYTSKVGIPEWYPMYMSSTGSGKRLHIGCRAFTSEHTKLLLKWAQS